MLDSNISTYIDKDGNVKEVGSGGTVDASTLNGVITGTNGITTALNATGDKVEVGMSLPIVFSGASSSGSIIQGTYNSGNPAAAMIDLNYYGHSISISPVQMAIRGESNGHTNALVLESAGIKYTQDGTQYAILRQDNVKTVNGQSIYGSIYTQHKYVNIIC